MNKLCKLLVLIAFILIQTIKTEDDSFLPGENLEGPDVCKRIITHNVTVVVTEMVPYQESKMEWCAAFPPRCKKTIIRLKQVNKTDVVEKTQAIRECCEGYKENEQKNRCILDEKISNIQNDDKCEYGVFGSSGSCSCDAGWMGKFCNETCSDGTWGFNCQNSCDCKNNFICRKYDGRCLCGSGYTGETCDQQCPRGFYGSECSEVCECPDVVNYHCHHITGCTCRNGFEGENCTVIDERK